MYPYIMVLFVPYMAAQAVESFELNTSTIGPTTFQCSTCVTQISDGQIQAPWLSSSSYQKAAVDTMSTTVPMSESSQPTGISHSSSIGFSTAQSLCLPVTETTTVVITLSPISSFSTTANSSNELSLLQSGDSHSTIPPSPIQPSPTLSALLSPAPVPVPVSTTTVSQATCKAATEGITTTVTICTNYITDGGQSLIKQLMLSCSGSLAKWTVSTSQTEFPLSGGSWKANQEFPFTIQINPPSEL